MTLAKTFLVSLLALPLSGCIMTLDFFWFNGEALDAYTLPDNHIPAEQLEHVTFLTEDNVTIHAYWAGQLDGPRAAATVLYCHGNSENLDHYWGRIQLLWDMGYNVFAYDYRSFGMSDDVAPTEAGLYADHRAALSYLLSRDDWTTDKLAYYGYSLGSIMAIQGATELAPKALITESALASAQAFLEDGTRLPLDVDMFMDVEFDNLGKIPSLGVPYLALHGTLDDFIKFEFSEMLVDAAQEPKKLVPAEGANHSDSGDNIGVPTTLGEQYALEVGAWIDQYVLGL